MRLVDAQGVEVTLAARPERIVSAAPAVTEILFAIGAEDRVVAVTDQCTYPSDAEKLPRIGGFWTPSAEKALGARPDLVIGQRGNPPDFVSVLRKSGVPVFTIDPQTMEDIFLAIREIARLVGDERAGEEVVGRMQARLDAVDARVADVPLERRPTVFMIVQVMPVWTPGRGTFQHDAIEAAGARNIASDVQGFSAYSTESLMAKDPDYLLLSEMNGDREAMKREVMNTPGIRSLRAVREGRIIVLESDPIMRTCPRIVDAVETMARAFYPERFDASDGSG